MLCVMWLLNAERFSVFMLSSCRTSNLGPRKTFVTGPFLLFYLMPFFLSFSWLTLVSFLGSPLTANKVAPPSGCIGCHWLGCTNINTFFQWYLGAVYCCRSKFDHHMYKTDHKFISLINSIQSSWTAQQHEMFEHMTVDEVITMAGGRALRSSPLVFVSCL